MSKKEIKNQDEQAKKLGYFHATYQAMSSVEASKENLENLFYELPEVLFVIDKDFRILKSNRSGDLLFSPNGESSLFKDFRALFGKKVWNLFYQNNNFH